MDRNFVTWRKVRGASDVQTEKSFLSLNKNDFQSLLSFTDDVGCLLCIISQLHCNLSIGSPLYRRGNRGSKNRSALGHIDRFLDLNSDLFNYSQLGFCYSMTFWIFDELSCSTGKSLLECAPAGWAGSSGQEYRSQWAWWHSVSHEGNDLAHWVVLGDRPEQKSGAYREDCIQLEVRTTPSLRPYWFQDCNQDERGRRQQSFPEECRWQIMLSVPREAGCTTMWMQLMAMNCTLKNG